MRCAVREAGQARRRDDRGHQADPRRRHGRAPREFFDFARLQMSPAPSKPVPFYVGGHTDVALRRAARVGDGWTSAMIKFDDLVAVIDRLRCCAPNTAAATFRSRSRSCPSTGSVRPATPNSPTRGGHRHHHRAVDLRRPRLRLSPGSEEGIFASLRGQVHSRKGRCMSEEHPARIAARASQTRRAHDARTSGWRCSPRTGVSKTRSARPVSTRRARATTAGTRSRRSTT